MADTLWACRFGPASLPSAKPSPAPVAASPEIGLAFLSATQQLWRFEAEWLCRKLDPAPRDVAECERALCAQVLELAGANSLDIVAAALRTSRACGFAYGEAAEILADLPRQGSYLDSVVGFHRVGRRLGRAHCPGHEILLEGIARAFASVTFDKDWLLWILALPRSGVSEARKRLLPLRLLQTRMLAAGALAEAAAEMPEDRDRLLAEIEREVCAPLAAPSGGTAAGAGRAFWSELLAAALIRQLSRKDEVRTAFSFRGFAPFLHGIGSCDPDAPPAELFQRVLGQEPDPHDLALNVSLL